MATPPVEKDSRPPGPATSPRPRPLSWLLLGALAAVGLGGVGAASNLAGFAPVGILPIGVGVALGAILVALAAATHVACRKQLFAGAILLSLVAVLAEHAWLYHSFRQQWHEARAKSPHMAMFRPETPWSPREYFAHEATSQQVALWCVDGALIVASTAGAVALARRLTEKR